MVKSEIERVEVRERARWLGGGPSGLYVALWRHRGMLKEDGLIRNKVKKKQNSISGLLESEPHR